MYCPVCLAPEGSWYPLTTPGNFFFGGGNRVPAVGAGPRGLRPRRRRRSAMASWAPSSAMASWAPSSAMASRAPSSTMVPVCLFCSGGPRPAFLSVSVLRGLQSAHPPSPMELLRLGTSLSGGGSHVSPLSCVSCVPATCFLIWFVSCPRLMWLLVNSCPAVFMWLCVNYPVYLVSVFWVRFRLVYSLLPVFPDCQPCLVLIKDCYLSLRPRLRVPVYSLLCAPWQVYSNF